MPKASRLRLLAAREEQRTYLPGRAMNVFVRPEGIAIVESPGGAAERPRGG